MENRLGVKGVGWGLVSQTGGLEDTLGLRAFTWERGLKGQARQGGLENRLGVKRVGWGLR